MYGSVISGPLQALSQEEWTAPADAEPLRLLGQRRRRDFIEGESVRVQGWIMAKTEARLCALAALTPRPAA